MFFLSIFLSLDFHIRVSRTVQLNPPFGLVFAVFGHRKLTCISSIDI